MVPKLKTLQVEDLTTCLPSSTLQQHGIGDGGHICSRYCKSVGMLYRKRGKKFLSYLWGIIILIYMVALRVRRQQNGIFEDRTPLHH